MNRDKSAEHPVLIAIRNAPIDHEWSETPEQRAEINAAKAWARGGGRMIPHSEVMASIEHRSSAAE